MRSLIALVLLMATASCAVGPQRPSGDILVIGDSVMAWNRGSGGDIGHVTGAELDRDVTNHSVVGAGIRSGGLGLLARPIPAQLPAGRWNWVIMNGGANDLGSTCGCTRCDAVIDGLISKDGRTGDIPRLIAAARAQGAQVLWMGYYQTPSNSLFAGCRPALIELERRIAFHAASQSGVYFVDAEDVMTPNRLDLLAGDRTHPSASGSLLIGRYLSRVIAENSVAARD
jgi:acyl-CoA thioesterase I